VRWSLVVFREVVAGCWSFGCRLAPSGAAPPFQG
jgi:hypothetical protein